MKCRNSELRYAFTLIELLVVIALIMVLAGLAAAFLPTIGNSARAARAATNLQQWVLTAKQKALRDRVPCGLRLLPPSFTAWSGAAVAYTKNTCVINTNILYTCISDHISSPATRPGTVGGAARWAAGINVVECQYIEQPDDYTVNSTAGGTIGFLSIAKTAANQPINTAQPLQWVAIEQVNLSNQDSGVPVVRGTNEVETGDYLEILGGGLMYRISAAARPVGGAVVGVLPTGVFYQRQGAAINRTLIHLATPLPYSFQATRNYRIVRAPRPTGDDILQLPDGVVIDLATNPTYINPLPTPNTDGSYDILFSPSGAVISPGTVTDSINLWVREAGQPASASAGEQTILAVYVRTGLSAAHPPAPGADPYQFIRDGRTSGK